MMNARKSRAISTFSFQRASASTTTPPTTTATMNARWAVPLMKVVSPPKRRCKPGRNATRPGEAAAMLAEQDEEVCLIARRHGIVLARPIMRSLLLAVIGIFLLTLPWVAAAGLGAL